MYEPASPMGEGDNGPTSRCGEDLAWGGKKKKKYFSQEKRETV